MVILNEMYAYVLHSTNFTGRSKISKIYFKTLLQTSLLVLKALGLVIHLRLPVDSLFTSKSLYNTLVTVQGPNAPARKQRILLEGL